MDVNFLTRRALPAALMIGATLRLARLVTTDTLGRWLIVEPARAWAERSWQDGKEGGTDQNQVLGSQEVESGLGENEGTVVKEPGNEADTGVSNFTPEQREEIARLIAELDPSTWETVSHVTHKDLWADLTYEPPILVNWRAKLVNGLTCPYCVGFWIGAGVIISHELAHSRDGSIYKSWKLVAGALTMNYVVGHIMEVLDS